MFIVAPTVGEEALGPLLERVNQVIVGKGGQVDDLTVLGRRRLAYPIRHHDEGVYVLTRFEAHSEVLAELEREFRLNESILRHLVIRRDEKVKAAEAAKAAAQAEAAAEPEFPEPAAEQVEVAEAEAETGQEIAAVAANGEVAAAEAPVQLPAADEPLAGQVQPAAEQSEESGSQC